MARNRFEQVDEIQPDAITLILKRENENDGETATIVFPVSAASGRLSEDQISPPLPVQDAYRGAIRLANDMKVAIVVCDPDAVWKSDWGDLYRPID